MNHKMYLVHEEDYLKQLEDKVKMYQLVRQLVQTIHTVPVNRGTRLLTEVTDRLESVADRCFESWNIPSQYMATGDPAWLRRKMAYELISPEGAGICLPPCEPEKADKPDVPEEASQLDPDQAAALEAFADAFIKFLSDITMYCIAEELAK